MLVKMQNPGLFLQILILYAWRRKQISAWTTQLTKTSTWTPFPGCLALPC